MIMATIFETRSRQKAMPPLRQLTPITLYYDAEVVEATVTEPVEVTVSSTGSLTVR